MSDYDKGRDRKKKFFPPKDRDPTVRRPFIMSKVDREKEERDKIRDKVPSGEKEKQPTILTKPREPSTAKEPETRPQSPKRALVKDGEIETQVIHPTKIAQNDSKDKKIDTRTAAAMNLMSSPMKLIDLHSKSLEDVAEFNNACQDYLIDSNTNFLVVGVVGMQGVGKSTILSLLAHSHDMEGICNKILVSHENKSKSDDDKADDAVADGLKFKSQDMDQIELGQHCTTGVDIYVTRDRVILLDMQPVCSASVMDSVLAKESLREIRGTTVNLERSIHTESLQLTSFLLAVCHVVIVVQDWFIDSNIIRFIQAAEILKPSLTVQTAQSANATSIGHEQTDAPTSGDHHPHVLFLHNRCQMDDFKPENVKMMQDLYKTCFGGSKLHTASGMCLYLPESKENGDGSYAVCHNFNSERCGSPMNLFLMPEVPDDYGNKNIYRGHPTIEELAQRLHYTVFGATRNPLTNIQNFSEKNWLHYAMKAWDSIKICTFYMEYSRLMP